jgi:5-methyltetrahydropteroyltriglutamate--homocysteine methyltransferase
MDIKTTLFGYPKIGIKRELKNTVEGYWDSRISEHELFQQVENLNAGRVSRLAEANLDYIPVNDFSLYDSILDLSTMFGVIPERFKSIEDGLTRYFAMARGHGNAVACEMTKWFDTNYHYIVPELNGKFDLVKNRPLESYRWARTRFGFDTKPVIIGPFTYISIGKIYESKKGAGHVVKASEHPGFGEMVRDLATYYNQMLKELQAEGTRIVQIDEPALVYDLTDDQIKTLIDSYRTVTAGIEKMEIFVHTYYESLSAFNKIVQELPVRGIGLDFIADAANYQNIKKYGFPKDKKLIAGVLSGRRPWKTDLKSAVKLVEELSAITGPGNLILSNAAPLYHLPVSLAPEKGHLDDSILKMLSFADERLDEMKLIKGILSGDEKMPAQDLQGLSERHANRAVREAVAGIQEKSIKRPHPFKKRYKKQIARLKLPQFPSMTIGSFPQTAEVRKKRSEYVSGKLSAEEYERYIKSKITEVIRMQEEIGLDVLVHGEFERTDMVEYFGQMLKGFAFTRNGWVQSYGTRCVRPPIIYGDVWRPAPMTVKEAVYAQSLTEKPVKGMMTGPVTILNWSFYRNDIPKKEIAYQIALALKEEVSDLEKAGIKIIQIDEPAFREGLPLKKSKQGDYLSWAITAFRITNAHVSEETQIQAHMCYSDFNEIIEYIYAMDSDVMQIEGSKNKGEILDSFEKFKYDHGIGIGVYDVHSPRTPGTEEIKAVIDRALKSINKDLLWINPDCGLKTRTFEDILPALRNMVAVARALR